MRQLRLFEHITLDGVIQHSADGGDDYAHGDWTAPYRSLAGREALLAAQGDRFDLLLGRRTYDIWSGHWPQAPGSPMADAINTATKYVVTHRSASMAWGPVQAVGPDLAEGVRRLKAQDGPGLILWGSSTLTSTLLQLGLADEVLLLVYPVLLGAGKRFLAPGMPPCAFELISSQALPTGVVFSRYAVQARPVSATVGKPG